jgi:two-component system, OmpR family, phosphate regulon sensor histidine kinase PhoR
LFIISTLSFILSLIIVSNHHTLGLIAGTLAFVALTVFTIWNPLLGLVAICATVVSAIVTRLIAVRKTDHNSTEPAEPNRTAVSLDNKDKNSSKRRDVSPGALLDATMNSMREGVLIVDHEMRIIAANSAATDTFQSAEGKVETLRLSDLTRNPSIHDAFRVALETGEHAEGKVEMRRGDRRIFHLRVEPLRFEPTGRSRGAIGVFIDITQLERLERVRQEFLSNVSHELRTPLTAIMAFVETLEEGAMEDIENNRRFLEVIHKNAERMHNLIDDILELSSIEAGIISVEPAHLRPKAVVNDIIAALAANAESRDVTLRNEIDIDVTVFADERRLEQMLTNLISNAIKFNREGGDVVIRYSETKTNDYISVTDNGDGISSEHIERIFERFYRIDRARSREIGGTGLGLAIVKHLARAHGGEASVKSTPGQGSTFTIELPRRVIAES